MESIIKKVALLILCMNGLSSAYAQFAESNGLYLTTEVGIGNYFGLDMNLNYVLKEKYAFKIGYSGHIRNPHSIPEDYSSGILGLLLLGLNGPFDYMTNYQLAVGKIYKLNDKGTIRINLNLGVGYMGIREPKNWTRIDGFSVGSDYSWEYGRYYTVGLIINPKIELPFTSTVGITISPMVQINKDRAYFGLGIGQMIGVLRPKKEVAKEVEKEQKTP
tara:strand:+ start:2590 stop:3243 length:654 start_codon:yes stop_codon:yes gene_type:complete